MPVKWIDRDIDRDIDRGIALAPWVVPCRIYKRDEMMDIVVQTPIRHNRWLIAA
jgi:hypothetical protein